MECAMKLRIMENVLLFTAVIFSLTLSGCAKKVTETSEKGSFQAEVTVREKLKTGRNVVELRLQDSEGGAVEGAEIEVTPWMPEMDHGVLFMPKVKEKGGGLYEVIFHLSMGGLWELRMEITKGEVTDSMVFTFPDVKGKEK
jgi:hypothetical protein